MSTYKLIGTKPDETPDAAIIRCANNLVKAILASGRSLHSTPAISGVDLNLYNHRPQTIQIENILGGWKVSGKSAVKVTFKLTQDE